MFIRKLFKFWSYGLFVKRGNMTVAKVSVVKKRDSRIVNFDKNKVINAVRKAAYEVHVDPGIAGTVANQVASVLFVRFRGKIPSVEDIQDIVEEILVKKGYAQVAKAYILYREKRKELRGYKAYYGVKDDLKLGLNSVKVLQKRYLLRDEEGSITETPLEMLRRVAHAVALPDVKYGRNPEVAEEQFFEVMNKLEFLPNSPCLMNAGARFQMLNACFVLPVEDSLDRIFDTLKVAGIIQKYAGGTGFSFSQLRPEGSIVRSTKGVASGPVSFMGLFDKMTDVVKQGGKRRGANMGLLRIDHPEIMKFINCKSGGGFSNFNTSVVVTDDFMRAVFRNRKYKLKFGDYFAEVSAKNVFESIINEAWKNGDPGLVFIDEINRRHGISSKIEATNPCGEQPLLPYESCVLGSINLGKFVNEEKVQWGKLREVIRIAVHFLDNVIDANYYVIKEIELVTLENRKIGLGVMGWADMLIKLGIRYDSKSALNLAGRTMKFISEEARKISYELALERGSFPNFDNSKLSKKWKTMRNLTVTTIAPTGTISIIANSCSSGIEPLFAISYTRDVLDGNKLFEANSLFEETAKKRKFYSDELMHEVARAGSVKHIRQVPKDVKNLFVTALDIGPEWHVRMQAAFQKYTDNGVSKTVNLPSEATKEDVRKAYLLAYKLKCKGITVFRYGSKAEQVLYLGEEFTKECPVVDCGN